MKCCRKKVLSKIDADMVYIEDIVSILAVI